MMNNLADRTDMVVRKVQLHRVLIALVALVSMGLVVAFGRLLESHPRPASPALTEERLYMNGATVKHMSLGFRGLIADWYWLRSLQYVGRKATNTSGFKLDNIKALDLRLLAPLLDAATTLDPQFIAVYEYGAVVLPEVSDEDHDEQAIALLKKGVAANPAAWRLYHHLGYIYWQRQDYKAAREIYSAGAKIAGAPRWMEAMSARMEAEGGSRATAREMYQRMYEQADDAQIRRMAELHLAQLNSLDERDAIRRVLAAYRERSGGRCPSSWQEIGVLLGALGLHQDQTGAPLDPSNVAYVLVKERCDVKLGEASKILR
jgi:tetratricopeptide (TPR) repeat protein